ncbi:MAG TPA: hypothetical protein DHV59_10630 [Oxalobacteraceae bacterium]|nr:hypothetical protein [Oxalobacteraceae bacterium]
MNTGTAMAPATIRLLFELERDDNPRLYDDLIRFKKGTKRVNRLRTLAQEGLLAQHWPIGSAGQWVAAREEVTAFGKDDAAITNQVFEQPIVE